MIVLSGDIGGTTTRLQLTDFADQAEPKVLARANFKSAAYKSFREIAESFLTDARACVTHACFAVAGPIVDGVVKLTNLPWLASEILLKDALQIPYLKLINDFEAIGYGILSLAEDDYVTLQVGEPKSQQVKSIIGAGTGLGVALLHSDQDHYRVMPTEGGHVDFAPTDEMQMQLLAYLLKKFHRVSFERVVSGIGLVNIYKFVRDNPLFNESENPELQRLSYLSDDLARDITDFAINHKDPMALRTLDLFLRCYGACAGNLALTTLPYGGLYIVGGIAPKLLSSINDGRFMAAFTDKGRMSDLLRKVPVYVVLNTDVGLTGAAYYATYLIEGE